MLGWSRYSASKTASRRTSSASKRGALYSSQARRRVIAQGASEHVAREDLELLDHLPAVRYAVHAQLDVVPACQVTLERPVDGLGAEVQRRGDELLGVDARDEVFHGGRPLQAAGRAPRPSLTVDASSTHHTMLSADAKPGLRCAIPAATAPTYSVDGRTWEFVKHVRLVEPHGGGSRHAKVVALTSHSRG
jgi:hypothetical protein